jgi:autotransporter-associated beta strand protein
LDGFSSYRSNRVFVAAAARGCRGVPGGLGRAAGFAVGVIACLALCASAPRAAIAQTITWTGLGSTTSWSDSGNWNGTAPVDSGTRGLVFSGATGLSSSNNLTNLTLGASGTAGIRFTTSGFTLSGNSVVLSGSILNLATTGTNTINLGMNLAAAGQRTISGTAGSTLVLAGSISGSGGMSFSRTAGTGSTSFVISGSNSFRGQTIFGANTVVTITNSNALGAGEVVFGSGLAFTNAAGPLVLSNNTSWAVNGNAPRFELAGGSMEFTGTTTVSVASGVQVNGGSLTVRTITGNGAGPTSQGGQIQGSGTLAIKEASTYTSSWRLGTGSGWLLIGDAAALGSGTLHLIDAASMQLGTTKDLTISTRIASSLGGRIGGDYTLTVDQPITGTNTANIIQKVGSGTLALTANNTFAGTLSGSQGTLLLSGSNTGNVRLNGPTARLVLGNPSAVGGTLTLTQGTLANTAAVTTLAGNRPISLGIASGTVTFVGPYDLDLGDGAVTTTDSVTFDIPSNTLRLGGNIGTPSSNKVFTKLGAGTLRLSGSNAFGSVSASQFHIRGGAIRFDTPESLPGGSGTSGNTSGILVYDGAIGLGFTSGTFARALGNQNSGINLSVSTGTSGFAGYGSATQVVNITGTSPKLTFGQTYFIPSATGRLGFGAANAEQAVDFQNPLDLNGAEQTVAAIKGQVDLVGILSGVVSNGSLRKTGLGTLALTAANTYTGTTTVSQGTLQIGNGGTTGSLAANSRVNVSSGATLAFNRSNDLSYSGTVTGGGGLRKLGAGKLTLTTAQTFTGDTVIVGGTLALGSGATLGSGLIKVGETAGSGAVLDIGSLGAALDINAGKTLGGYGTVTGNTVVIANSGVISPGGSVGGITIGNLEFGKAGVYTFELNDATGSAGGPSGNGWDLVTVSDGFTLTADATDPFVINLVSLNGTAPGSAVNFDNSVSYQWKFLVANAPISNFNQNYFQVTYGSFVNPTNGSFVVAQGGAGGLGGSTTSSELYVVYSAVPEPGTLALAGIGVAAAAWAARRRRA